MRKFIIILQLICFNTLFASAQTKSDENIEMFVFTFENDSQFMRSIGNNGAEIDRLFKLIDKLKTKTSMASFSIYVDSYSSSLPSVNENTVMARTRAKYVKSYIMIKKGAVESNFITRIITRSWEGKRDVVVVSLHLPEDGISTKPIESEILAESKKEEYIETKVFYDDFIKSKAPDEPQKIEKTEPEIAIEPDIIVEPEEIESTVSEELEEWEEPEYVELNPIDELSEIILKPKHTATSDSYTFALRTNLLYDSFLLPNIGFEWRIGPLFGLKLDAGTSYWGTEEGFVQKMYILNPEVRFYMGHNRNFYLGAAANLLKYNTYGGMVGLLLPDEIGYQGELWNTGLTMGYQLPVGEFLAFDFNLGLGYNNANYDSFTMINDVRIERKLNQTTVHWGIIQAGVSLIWKFWH